MTPAKRGEDSEVPATSANCVPMTVGNCEPKMDTSGRPLYDASKKPAGGCVDASTVACHVLMACDWKSA